MERERLDRMQTDELRREAAKYRLRSTGGREELIDAIMSHFEGFRSALEESTKQIRSQATSQPEASEEEVFARPELPPSARIEAPASAQPPWDALARCLTALSAQMQQQVQCQQ